MPFGLVLHVLRQAGSNRFFRFSFRGDLFLFKDERHQPTALMMSRAAKGLRHVVPCFLHLESFAIPPGFQMFSLGILSVNACEQFLLRIRLNTTDPRK